MTEQDRPSIQPKRYERIRRAGFHLGLVALAGFAIGALCSRRSEDSSGQSHQALPAGVLLTRIHDIRIDSAVESDELAVQLFECTQNFLPVANEKVVLVGDNGVRIESEITGEAARVEEGTNQETRRRLLTVIYPEPKPSNVRVDARKIQVDEFQRKKGLPSQNCDNPDTISFVKEYTLKYTGLPQQVVQRGKLDAEHHTLEEVRRILNDLGDTNTDVVVKFEDPNQKQIPSSTSTATPQKR